MLRSVMSTALLTGLFACQPAPTASEQRSEPAADTAGDADQSNKAASKTKTPINLPSQQNQAGKGYAMPPGRPDEVCMQKGFTWLYNGYLRPECGTCHTKDNRYGVTAFAQGADEAASFAVLKTTTSTQKLLEAVLGNVFCKSCVITKDDPLYADLEYFTQHMDRCEKATP